MVINSKILVVYILTVLFEVSCVNTLYQRDVESDDDNILQQALYLVKLLRSDYVKSLRENDELDVTVNEENTTCPENITDVTKLMNLNSITPLAEGRSTLSLINNHNEISSPLLQPITPPMLNYVPPSIVQTAAANIPQEKYKFPYRLQRRRMVPDYYYHGNFRGIGDADFMSVQPNIQAGNYRRLGYDVPIYGLNPQKQKQGGIAPTASTYAPVTSSTTSTSKRPHTTTNTPKFVTTKSRKKLLKKTKRMLTTADEDNIPSLRSSKITSSAGIKNTPHVKKLKQRTNPPSSEESTSEDYLMSQVASELINEIGQTKTVKPVILRNIVNKVSRQKLGTITMFKSTMKLYLKGSSRIPIPFPENNAFCHLHPQNKLCGAGI